MMEEEVISLTPAMLLVILDFRFVNRGGGHISHSCGPQCREFTVKSVDSVCC
jgi:hypothetical protein